MQIINNIFMQILLEVIILNQQHCFSERLLQKLL